MTHPVFIAAAYALSVLAPAVLALGAARRLTVARRRLLAIDPRAGDARRVV